LSPHPSFFLYLSKFTKSIHQLSIRIVFRIQTKHTPRQSVWQNSFATSKLNSPRKFNLKTYVYILFTIKPNNRIKRVKEQYTKLFTYVFRREQFFNSLINYMFTKVNVFLNPKISPKNLSTSNLYFLVFLRILLINIQIIFF
jgi:hypothetical protein